MDYGIVPCATRELGSRSPARLAGVTTQFGAIDLGRTWSTFERSVSQRNTHMAVIAGWNYWTLFRLCLRRDFLRWRVQITMNSGYRHLSPVPPRRLSVMVLIRIFCRTSGGQPPTGIGCKSISSGVLNYSRFPALILPPKKKAKRRVPRRTFPHTSPVSVIRLCTRAINTIRHCTFFQQFTPFKLVFSILACYPMMLPLRNRRATGI
ncbi:hypothetical protein DFH07DRAFT_279517 [Mycena maculata]|uniref:Uncharacterized protein n=1 Tax=Mycena maculata TaxID=230809 RepID=A0AAD7HLN5_9AGAR|nr:hypothetical protein DFH07DRAFT_279517 [Mycena maculata]